MQYVLSVIYSQRDLANPPTDVETVTVRNISKSNGVDLPEVVVVKKRPSWIDRLMNIMIGKFYWLSLSGIFNPMFTYISG